MLSYRPGDSLAHRLDPRSKLALQVGVAVAAVAHPRPVPIAALTGFSLAALLASRLSPFRVLHAYRVVLVFLLWGPVLAAVTLESPWIRPARALDSLVAVSRVVPVLLVSAVYVATTPVRETRAAIRRLVPGSPGRALAVAVALVVRFLPVVLADVRRARAAVQARAGDERGVLARARLVALGGLRRAFQRADRLALALRARCFAWNPTLPALSFGPADYPVLFGGVALAATALL